MAIGALVVPGAMLPVLNDPPSAATLCVMLSAFRHATVGPAVTLAGFGEKDWLPFMPVIVIVTSAGVPPPPPPPPGFWGAVGLLLLPQLAATRAKTERATTPNV